MALKIAAPGKSTRVRTCRRQDFSAKEEVPDESTRVQRITEFVGSTKDDKPRQRGLMGDKENERGGETARCILV
jgi:hypothetical protein